MSWAICPSGTYFVDAAGVRVKTGAASFIAAGGGAGVNGAGGSDTTGAGAAGSNTGFRTGSVATKATGGISGGRAGSTRTTDSNDAVGTGVELPEGVSTKVNSSSGSGATDIISTGGSGCSSASGARYSGSRVDVDVRWGISSHFNVGAGVLMGLGDVASGTGCAPNCGACACDAAAAAFCFSLLARLRASSRRLMAWAEIGTLAGRGWKARSSHHALLAGCCGTL